MNQSNISTASISSINPRIVASNIGHKKPSKTIRATGGHPFYFLQRRSARFPASKFLQNDVPPSFPVPESTKKGETTNTSLRLVFDRLIFTQLNSKRCFGFTEIIMSTKNMYSTLKEIMDERMCVQDLGTCP